MAAECFCLAGVYGKSSFVRKQKPYNVKQQERSESVVWNSSLVAKCKVFRLDYFYLFKIFWGSVKTKF